MRVELLYFEGCPAYEELLPRLRRILTEEGVTDAPDLCAIEDDETAARARFLGSPTVRIEGEDVEPGAAARTDFSVTCRLYRTEEGTARLPREEWIRDALRRQPRT